MDDSNPLSNKVDFLSSPDAGGGHLIGVESWKAPTGESFGGGGPRPPEKMEISGLQNNGGRVDLLERATQREVQRQKRIEDVRTELKYQEGSQPNTVHLAEASVLTNGGSDTIKQNSNSSSENATQNTTQEEVTRQEVKLTPDEAVGQLFVEMDKLEAQGAIPDAFVFIDRMEELLKTSSATLDARDYLRLAKVFREDDHFKKLNIRSPLFSKNSLPRDIHTRVIDYMKGVGIYISDTEMIGIKEKFLERDTVQRARVLISYAEHGLLTLRSLAKKGIIAETSASPGDFGSLEDAITEGENVDNIRGYEISGVDPDAEEKLFYGRNGFFNVALERGDENIDRSQSLSRIEIENRLRNSVMFVTRADKLSLSSRNDTAQHEDIVSGDISPEIIDYVVVADNNFQLAEETFKDGHTKVIRANNTQAEIHSLPGQAYTTPDYFGEVSSIAKQEGNVWCHIARLPIDTYPTSSS